MLADGLKLGLRGVARSLRWVIDDAPIGPDGQVISDVAIAPSGPYMFGNPGRGAMASRPKATREYRALEVTLERTAAGPFSFLLSYVLSSNLGNYAGLYNEDMPNTFGGSNAGTGFDLPDVGGAYSTGPLPNNRTHLLKFSGTYRIGAVATLGATFVASSGTPRSEMGGHPWPGSVVFVQSRGSLDRTPWLWDLNLRATWALPMRGGIRPRLLLDVFHVGNPRTAVMYNDRHYDSPPVGGVWGTPSLNYGKVMTYQPPMYARLGMQLDF